MSSYNNIKNMYLSAYMKKSELIKSGEYSNSSSPVKIKTLAKIVDPPEKIYEHARGAVIGGIKSPTKATDRWWDMNPRLNKNETERAVDGQNLKMNKAQEKLSNNRYFTHSYRIKHNSGNAAEDYQGDYLPNPLKATKLLQSTSYNALTIPGRAADFKSEVTFRMSLRN